MVETLQQPITITENSITGAPGVRQTLNDAAGRLWGSLLARKETLVAQLKDDYNLLKAGIAPWDTKTGQQILASPFTWMAIAALMPRAMDGFDGFLQHGVAQHPDFTGPTKGLEGLFKQGDVCIDTVQRGDTFSTLAREHFGPGASYKQLHNFGNNSTVHPNPNSLHVGDSVQVPCDTSAVTIVPEATITLEPTPTVTSANVETALTPQPTADYSVVFSRTSPITDTIPALEAGTNGEAALASVSPGHMNPQLSPEARASILGSLLIFPVIAGFAAGFVINHVNYQVHYEPLPKLLTLPDSNFLLEIKLTSPNGIEVQEVGIGTFYEFYGYQFSLNLDEQGGVWINWFNSQGEPLNNLTKPLELGNISKIVQLPPALASLN